MMSFTCSYLISVPEEKMNILHIFGSSALDAEAPSVCSSATTSYSQTLHMLWCDSGLLT